MRGIINNLEEIYTDYMGKREFDSYYYYGNVLISATGTSKKESLANLIKETKEVIKTFEDQINLIKKDK